MAPLPATEATVRLSSAAGYMWYSCVLRRSRKRNGRGDFQSSREIHRLVRVEDVPAFGRRVSDPGASISGD